jgi:hypothetical protein
MRVSKIRCDECKREEEIPDAAGWYVITRFGERALLFDEGIDVFDLCSLPCMVTFATHRELVRVAS